MISKHRYVVEPGGTGQGQRHDDLSKLIDDEEEFRRSLALPSRSLWLVGIAREEWAESGRARYCESTATWRTSCSTSPIDYRPMAEEGFVKALKLFITEEDPQLIESRPSSSSSRPRARLRRSWRPLCLAQVLWPAASGT